MRRRRKDGRSRNKGSGKLYFARAECIDHDAEEAGDVISLRAKVGGTLRLSTGIKKLISSGILNYRDFVRFLIFFFLSEGFNLGGDNKCLGSNLQGIKLT